MTMSRLRKYAPSKKYEELQFTDDFMFGKVLYSNPDLCKEILELILNKKIRKIKFPEIQKVITITGDAKGVRFDVYTEDDENSVYDVEMQLARLRNLPKRSRYYHGMIDLNMIESGADYEELKDSYVIFICNYPMKNGASMPVSIYEYRNTQDLSMRLGDGAYTVIVNAYGNDSEVSEKMRAFLKYLRTGIPEEDAFTNRIHNDVLAARAHEEWKVEYMTLLERDKENQRIGEEIGMIQGLVQTYHELGFSLEEIAGKVDLPVDEVLEILKKMDSENE